MGVRTLALAALGALVMAACGGARPESGGPTAPPLNVIAAESFLADIAQNVAGDRVKVDTLIPLGVDPHGFQATPADIRKVAQSQVLIVNGAGFEAFLEDVLANAGGERTVIEAARGIASRTAREGETAVMTPDEQTAALCGEAGSLSAEALTAGSESATATEMSGHHDTGDDASHQDETHLLRVSLTKQNDGSYAGYLKLDAEAGELAIAAGSGTLAVTRVADATPIEPEETLNLACTGLAQATIMDLEHDEYLISLTGFNEPETTLMYGMLGGHHHDSGDPHFWLNPLNVITYVANIRDGLIAADPAGAETYRANAERYTAQLRELDNEISAQIEQIAPENRQLVTNHESFGYYADRYGFRIVGTIVPSVSTDAAPSAQQLALLSQRIRATGARVIFLEGGGNPQLAEQVARDTGIKIISDLYTHSLSPADGPAPTYLAMMRYNTQKIVTALTTN